MKKTLLSLSVASALALVAATPASHAQEEEIECDGVLVQSRFALANCLVESAAAIAATVVTQDGCTEGEWEIAAVVPEAYFATIPVQGYLTLIGNGDNLTLTGQSSAQLRNNVNCEVATTDSLNTFAGREINYSAGSRNFYVDAVIDKDLNLLCITTSQSNARILVEGSPLAYTETNGLDLWLDPTTGQIAAKGDLSISTRRGRDTVVLSGWQLAEEVVIPPLNQTADGFEFTAWTDDLGESRCEVEIEGSVENLEFPTGEDVGGFTVFGKLTIEAEEDEED